MDRISLAYKAISDAVGLSRQQACQLGPAGNFSLFMLDEFTTSIFRAVVPATFDPLDT
ncbi:hypothetical protein [Halomonas sp. M20]|uniref:hypothetical protein n=1 Tax=Halomonas sp. M20 TaxID=2763264 RepID=UPI001D0B1FD6|nr:hypothetical protein [Halomonas sp. M20]